MLVTYLHRLIGGEPAYRWLWSISPKRRPRPPYLYDESIVFPFASGGNFTWTDTDLLYVLQQSEPRFSVPLLWELCLCYDEYYETSELLRKYCKSEIRTGFENTCFYRERNTLKLEYWGKRLPSKKHPDIKVFVDKKKLVVTLRPTQAIHTILVDHLAEAVLGMQADCLWLMLERKREELREEKEEERSNAS